MRTLFSFIGIFLLTANMLSAAQPAKKKDAGLRELTGAWRMATLTEKEHSIALDEKCLDSLTFDDGKVRLVRDREEQAINVTISKMKDIYIIDFVLDETHINYAIMRILDGKLELCVSRKLHPNKIGDRPTEFTTNPEKNNNLSGLILFTFVKIDKK